MLYDFSRVIFSGNYVSPSGGFCNYGEFSGRGINPETGRSNQIKKVSARTLEEAVSKAEKESGFHHIELSAVPMDPPTERQIAYAKELSIKIPEGACKEDVMCLISRVADSPSDVPSPGCSQALASYLEKSGICFSAYISQPMALSWAVNMLPDREKCRFYAYCVWCPHRSLKSGFISKFCRAICGKSKLHQRIEKENRGQFCRSKWERKHGEGCEGVFLGTRRTFTKQLTGNPCE